MTEPEPDFDLLVVGGAGVDTVVRADRLEVPAAGTRTASIAADAPAAVL
ncbi:hypothetical protein [Kitasatospora sp. NPDC056184]